MRLKPEKTYYFRGKFRADRPARVSVGLKQAYGVQRTPTSAAVALGKDWKLVTATFKTPDDSRGYYLIITATGDAQAHVWMDEPVFSAQPVSAFAPSAPVEIGLKWPVAGKVFHLEDPVHFGLLARNYQVAAAAEADIRYRVVDYFDRVVTDKTLKDWGLPPGRTANRTLDLTAGRTGAFRLLIDGVAKTPSGNIPLPLQEYTFSVLPRPPKNKHRNFGAFINLNYQAVEIMSRAGIRRSVTLSCANDTMQLWSRMEPEPGKYVWRDQTVDFALKHGFNIIMDLEIHPSGIPKWAKNPGDPAKALDPNNPAKRIDPGAKQDVLMCGKLPFSKEAYEKFIEALVSHYKGKIDDYILVDEPYHYYSPEQYHELLKTTYTAAKRGNPNCRVLAHGSYYPKWVKALEKVLPYFDGIADYSRTPQQGALLKNYRDKHGKFILNVEYGHHASMYRTIVAPESDVDRRLPTVYTGNAESVVKGALRAMCWAGGIGFNRYDARFPGGDFMQLDRFKCLFEYDGSLKPAGVAYAVAGHFLDGFHGSEELQLNPGLETLLLEDETRFAIVVATREGRVLLAALDLPKGVEARDIMGNPLPRAPESAILHSAVNYLIGPASRLDATKSMLRKLALSPAVKIEATTYLDKKTGQFMLAARIFNLLKDRTLTGAADIGSARHAVLRNTWQAPKQVRIRPGQSAVVNFALNAYRGDSPPPRPSSVAFIFDSISAKKNIQNIYNLGTHAPPAKK